MSARRGSVARTLALMGAHPGLVAACAVLSVVVVASTLVLPVLSGAALDGIVGAGAVDFARVERMLALMGVAICVTALSQWALTDVSNRLVYGLMYELRARAFGKLSRLPLSYLDSHPSGDVASRIVTDVEQLSMGLLLGLQQLLTGVLTIVVTLAFMFGLDPLTTGVVVCVTPLSALVTSFIVRRSRAYFTEQNERRGAMAAIADEMVRGASTVRAFGMADEVCRRFDEADASLGDAMRRAVFVSSTANPSTRFVNSLVYAGVCVFGALAAIGGSVTVGGLSAFLSYANQYSKPFNDISSVLSELQNSFSSAERIFELLDEPEVELEGEGCLRLDEVRGKVVLEDVRFSYQRGREVLHGVSLAAEPGQTVAIVGPTGCGKTTLINLLMRFYEVDSGRILVDGVDERAVSRESLRSQWGMVLQEPWVAAGTIRDNIAMGRPEASDEEVAAAARRALADPFIRRLPKGYGTVLEPGGRELSAGQRQLLCIARLMLALPPMLILDEATSSIDTRTEQRVHEAMLRLMEGRTSFVVAHRLSTIRSADLICVMRDGRVAERWTHEELLAADGFYAELYRAQFAGVDEG